MTDDLHCTVLGDITPPTIPTPEEARAAWLAGRTAALRAFVCEMMSGATDPPPYRFNVDTYPDEARQEVARECASRGWAVTFENAPREMRIGNGPATEYTVRVMKVWQP